MTRPFTAVATRLQALGFDDGVVEQTLAPARELLEGPPRILFIGGFNAGKSSVINALVGVPVAPVGATPVTALVTHVRYGDAHRVRCVARGGERSWLEPEAYANLVDQSATATDAAARRAAISYVEVFYPAEVLKRATLVDSPGLGSFDPRDDETTLAHLTSADAICWVFDIEPGPQGPLVETIRRLAPQMPLTWGVLNKADLKTPTERLQVQECFDSALGLHFRRLKLFSASQAIAVAAGRAVHPDDAAGVRLDVVEQILRVLGDGPRKAPEEARPEAIAMARDAACWLIGARWREVVADIAAIERFDGLPTKESPLMVFDEGIGRVIADAATAMIWRTDPVLNFINRANKGEGVATAVCRYRDTSAAFLRRIEIAIRQRDPPWRVPKGFIDVNLLRSYRKRAVVWDKEDFGAVAGVILADPLHKRDVAEMPFRARTALRSLLEATAPTAPALTERDALESAARDLQTLATTD